MTAVNRNILWVVIVFVLIAVGVGIFYPREDELISNLNIGAGADVSGVILSETIKYMDRDTNLVEAMEFGDC